MKQLALIILLALSLSSYGQFLPNADTIKFNPNYYSPGYSWVGGQFRNWLLIPNDTARTKAAGSIARMGTAIYVANGTYWSAAGGSSYTAGYGLNLSGTTFSADTSVLSTRAWRQKGIDSVVALIGAGGGTLQSVLTADSNATKGILTTRKITSTLDSLVGWAGKIRGGLQVGDTLNTTLDSIQFWGNSVTAGYNAEYQSHSKSFAYQVAFHYGSFEWNMGISSTRMSGGSNSMESRIGSIPTYRSTLKYIMFDYGLNDGNAGVDTALFKTVYEKVIDTCIARGWPLSRIVVLAPTLAGVGGSGCPRVVEFVSASRSVANTKGVQFVNLYEYMLTNGGYATVDSDSLHPNVLGHKVAAEAITKTLGGYYGGGIQANVAQVWQSFRALGTSTFTGTSTFNGSVALNGNVTSNVNFTGGITVAGDNVVNQQKILLFKSGNIRYGMGVSAPSSIYTDVYSGSGSGNGVRLGTMSTSDGTTFTPSFYAGGSGNSNRSYTNLSVGGDFAPSDVLDVLGSGLGSGIRVKHSQSPAIGLWSSSANANSRAWAFTQNFVVFGDFRLGVGTANGTDPHSGNTVMYITKEGRVTFGTGADVASAALQVSSTAGGFMPPKMTATQASAISSPADGIMLYVTDTNGTFTSIGFWGRENGAWIKL